MNLVAARCCFIPLQTSDVMRVLYRFPVPPTRRFAETHITDCASHKLGMLPSWPRPRAGIRASGCRRRNWPPSGKPSCPSTRSCCRCTTRHGSSRHCCGRWKRWTIQRPDSTRRCARWPAPRRLRPARARARSGRGARGRSVRIPAPFAMALDQLPPHLPCQAVTGQPFTGRLAAPRPADRDAAAPRLRRDGLAASRASNPTLQGGATIRSGRSRSGRSRVSIPGRPEDPPAGRFRVRVRRPPGHSRDGSPGGARCASASSRP